MYRSTKQKIHVHNFKSFRLVFTALNVDWTCSFTALTKSDRKHFYGHTVVSCNPSELVHWTAPILLSWGAYVAFHQHVLITTHQKAAPPRPVCKHTGPTTTHRVKITSQTVCTVTRAPNQKTHTQTETHEG